MIGKSGIAFSDSIIGTYCELGTAALERGEFNIAEKMYQAALREPAVIRDKKKFSFPLLIGLGLTREGQKRLYKAKVIYIRALAHYKRYHCKNDSCVVEVLLMLARVNAKQGLFRQAGEFIDEARSTWLQIGRYSDALLLLIDENIHLFQQKIRKEELPRLIEFRSEVGSAPLSFEPELAVSLAQAQLCSNIKFATQSTHLEMQYESDCYEEEEASCGQ